MATRGAPLSAKWGHPERSSWWPVTKTPPDPDGPVNIGRARRYLDDVDRHLRSSTTPMEFFQGMTSLHLQRIHPGVLLSGAQSLLSGNSAQ
ncbi:MULTISPECIES: hypothetical protein [unclassified Streptomyces]|uniref:hypothetical protein n=1 Tax=unclassified Streptomyces TaxID=2593676 RepID=UPI003254D4EA